MISAYLLCAIWAIRIVHAIYYIDDRNSSITYNGDKNWTQDPDQGAYLLTLTYISDCLTTDGCGISFSFTGSGVTLNVAHDKDFVNVSIALDGSVVTDTALPPTSDSVEVYNVSVYSVDSLPYGYHVVFVSLMSLDNGGGSDFWFDYAAVDDTQPDAPATSTAQTASSVTSSISSTQPAAPATSTAQTASLVTASMSPTATMISAFTPSPFVPTSSPTTYNSKSYAPALGGGAGGIIVIAISALAILLSTELPF